MRSPFIFKDIIRKKCIFSIIPSLHRRGVCIHMYVLNWLFVSIGVSFLMEIFGVVEGKRDEGNYF